MATKSATDIVEWLLGGPWFPGGEFCALAGESMSAPSENTTANDRKMDDMAQRYPMQMFNVSATNANRA